MFLSVHIGVIIGSTPLCGGEFRAFASDHLESHAERAG
jgi:hypothetical protein